MARIFNAFIEGIYLGFIGLGYFFQIMWTLFKSAPTMFIIMIILIIMPKRKIRR